jgi:hypothetical protein
LTSGDLLTVAHLVGSVLGARDRRPLFAKWLKHAFADARLGRPSSGGACQDTTLIDALWSLRTPVITTNYDTLIEQAMGVGGDTWRNPSAMHRALTGDLPRQVIHLHGVWTDPESVILDPYAYGRLSEHPSTGEALRSIAYQQCFLFVGCAGALGDPTFGPLRDWMANTLKWSSVDHFVLVLDAERQAVRDQIGRDPIHTISYGAQHADLAAFIRRELQPHADVRSA